MYSNYNVLYIYNWSSTRISQNLFLPMIILTQARRKRCGMAAVAAPKICRERERKGREGRKEEKRGERKEEKKRKGEESKRERCIRPVGVKHPHSTVKRL